MAVMFIHIWLISRVIPSSAMAFSVARELRSKSKLLDLLRHTRAMHLYQAGMPLSLIGEWLGHSHLETTLIYAYADTGMKRSAVDKVTNANNTVFSNEEFIYKNDEEVIRKLYGLE